MLLSILPKPFVLSSIRLRMYPIALSLIFNPLAFVLFAIRCDISALTIEHVILPLSVVPTPIRPYADAFTLDIIISKLSSVDLPICEVQLPVPVLLPTLELAFIAGPTRILGGRLAVHFLKVETAAETMSPVFIPFSVVDIAVRVDQSALSVRFASLPEALVELPCVDTDLDSLSIFEAKLVVPFTLVQLLTVVFRSRNHRACSSEKWANCVGWPPGLVIERL